MVKNGFNPSGSQKYLCKVCRRVVTPQPTAVGASRETKQRAINMVLDGSSFRFAARHTGVTHGSVLAWFKDAAEQVPDTPVKPRHSPEQIELDEMFTFVQSKKLKRSSSPRSSVKRAVSRCFMSWRVVTERSAEVVQAMLDEVPNSFQYCTDGFSIYVGRNYHRGWHLALGRTRQVADLLCRSRQRRTPNSDTTSSV